MITSRGTVRSVRVPIVLVVSMIAFAAAEASAQEPPIECQTYQSSYPSQTIVVHLDGGVCKVNPYEGDAGIPMLRSTLGSWAHWEVCNKCGEPVDVRLRDSLPLALDGIFTLTDPPISADGMWLREDIPDNDQVVAFKGRVLGDEDVLGTQTYQIEVKLSSAGQGEWRGFDPELQIDANRSAPNILALIIAALAGVAAGFGTGWWFARRSTATTSEV